MPGFKFTERKSRAAPSSASSPRLPFVVRRVSSSDGPDATVAKAGSRRGRLRRRTSCSSSNPVAQAGNRRRSFALSSLGSAFRRPSLRRSTHEREKVPRQLSERTSATAGSEVMYQEVPLPSITIEERAPCPTRSPSAEEAIYEQHLENYLKNHFDILDGCGLACADEEDDGFDICYDPDEEPYQELSMRRIPMTPEDMLGDGMLPLLEVTVDEDEMSVVSDITYR